MAALLIRRLNSVARGGISTPMAGAETELQKELLDKIFDAAEIVHVKSARQAAEITLGRPMSEDEWQPISLLWETRWNERYAA